MSVPIDSNALSLADYAEMSNDPLVKKFIFSIYEDNNINKHIPFITDQALVSAAMRWTGDLPGINYVQINDQPVVTKGTPSYFNEQKYLIRNSVQSDDLLRKDKNAIGDPLAQQLRAYWKSLTWQINTDFINNDHITGNTKAPIGLRFRMTNPSQFDIPSEMAIDAGATMTTAMTSANANQFIEAIDALLSYLKADDGTDVILCMNDILIRRWAFAIRELGAGAGFEITKDAYDRQVLRYRNAIVFDPGRQNDQATRIISNTENSNGTAGSSTYTSVYGVKVGEESFCGLQFEEPAVKGPEEIPGTFNWVIKYQWAYGWWHVDNRSVGRLFDINLGSGTV